MDSLELGWIVSGWSPAAISTRALYPLASISMPPSQPGRSSTTVRARRTVSVKALTGRSLTAIDGKVDASTARDMLTQKTLAHLPLLLHPNPRDVGIVGLGSGVTLASALVHPIASVDIVEISPEVVERVGVFCRREPASARRSSYASVRGDGRTHLSLTSRRYDVIISEPSNPWMAGVATLFTQEFFQRRAAG